MKKRRINVTLTIVALALTALLILTVLPRASTAAPRLERQSLESLTELDSPEAAESGAPLAPSVVQSPSTTTRISAALRSGSVMFIENVGQFDEHARFQVRGGIGTMWLADDAIWVTVLEKPSSPQPPSPNLGEGGAFLPSPKFGRGAGGEGQPRKGVNLRLTFPGANPHPRLEPFERLDTVVSYFIGSDPDQWHPDVPVWGGVRYVGLYPGIDLEITGENGWMVQRLVAQPGADLSAVRLRVDGADKIDLDSDHLRLTTTVGEFTLPLLQAVAADGSPLLRAAEGPGPALSNAEGVRANEIITPFSSASLLPSPSAQTTGASDLLYSTFLGGGGYDYGYGIAVDGSGATCVAGITYSSNFPTTPGAFDMTPNGLWDAFVVKLNATGSALVYATFLGGGSYDYGYGIAVDGSGADYVTGLTYSSDFPTTPGAYNTSYNGGDWGDAFVVKLNATGYTLAYATFLGGSSEDHGSGITVDGSGAAYVTGLTWSSDFPTTPGAYDTSYNGGSYADAFVVKLNATGSALAYATFLGGSGAEGWGITVDGSGAAYVTGQTHSSNFPTTPGAFDTSYNGGDYDAFVVKLNAAGSSLAYATFLGGSGEDHGSGIAVDGSGAAYVTGYATSSNFPTTPGAFDATYNGGWDAFVVKLNPTGSTLTYATFLGGSDGDYGEGIAMDGSGATYVTGWTYSSDFPTTPGAFDTTYNGGSDAFVVKLNAAGSTLAYATFLGGGSGDGGSGIVVDGSGAAYVTGQTHSSNFPTTPGAFDTTCGGCPTYPDAFVVKLAVGGGVGPDFTITAIEVTQAIQDLNNSVPLVAGKRTFARVHVRNQGTSSPALVTARLCGPGRCLAPDNPGKRIQVLANPDRARLDQSFYFELPPEWLNGNLTLTAEVNPAGPQHVEESNTANNSLSRSVTFGAVPPLKIKLFGVRYRTLPFAWQVHEPRPEDYDLILSWLRRAYPTAEVQWSRDVLDYGLGLPTCNAVNKILVAYWLIDRAEDKTDSQTRYYGIVSDSGGFMRGCAMGIPSSIASGPAGTPGGSWVWDKDASYGDWYAGHELAHTYGRRHPGYCGGQERDPDHPSGDYPEGKISPADGSMYGFDIESTAVYTPTGWYDVMTYCDYEWISGFTYKGLRDYLVAQGGLAAQQVASVGEHLIVLGTVNHTQNTAELHTLYRVPDVTAPAPPASGTHHLKLLGAGDAVLANYPFTPGKDTSTQPGEDEMGLIGEIIPWVTGTQRVAVYSDTLELDSRLVSTNPPTVTVLSPNGSEVFTDTAVVSWSASDADQDPLTYVLQYSIDDGATWQAVGVGITNTTVYTLDLTLLPGTDQGRVRVIASDGVNTGIDISDSAFHVARKPPQARILSPASGSSFLSEQTLVLVGEGTDVEDGMLPDSALSWQSSLSGTLGTGRMLSVTGLITGTHVITLTATDSNSNMGTATVQVVATFPEDVVPDCQVDITDIMQVASRWRCKCEDACYDPRYDLDGDCDIDIVDIMLVVKHWGETC